MKIEDTLKNETREEILEKLKNDEHYYGAYGQQFLSNSNVGQLLNNPGDFNKPGEPSVPLLVGGAFHTMMLEPHKMGKYKVIDCSTRNTKKYKEESEGELCLVRKDIEMLERLRSELENHPFRYGDKSLLELVSEGEPEVPSYANFFGEWWKGKADVLNHDSKLIVDLKTTSNMDGFRNSATKWNYDSQAFIYRELFGYEMVFLVFDKKTGRIGFFECSEGFYGSGREKVVDAVYSYRTHIKRQESEEFNFNKYLTYEIL